jgi:hypothetical protein
LISESYALPRNGDTDMVQQLTPETPNKIELTGFILQEGWLEEIEEINNWISPRLGIRFELTTDNLDIYYPDGRKFLTSLELNQQMEQERQNYQDLLAKLQPKGIDINTL